MRKHGIVDIYRIYDSHNSVAPIVFWAESDPIGEKIYNHRDCIVFPSNDESNMILVDWSEIRKIQFVLVSNFYEIKKLSYEIHIPGEKSRERFSLPELPGTESKLESFLQGIDMFPILMQEVREKIFQ